MSPGGSQHVAGRKSAFNSRKKWETFAICTADEELLALGEEIGDVNVGLSPAQLTALHTFMSPPAGETVSDPADDGDGAASTATDGGDSERAGGTAAAVCVVCLGGFDVGEICKRLPCLHQFHGDCIDEYETCCWWLGGWVTG